MMNLKPEVVAQLERVLGSVEMLLPRTTKPVNWESCYAANWRRHSFSGYLEPVKVTDTTTLDELLGVEEQKEVILNNPRQFLPVCRPIMPCSGARAAPANHPSSRRC